MAANAPPSVWVLTDGKAGDEQPLIGLAEAMGAAPVVRRVAPRRPFALLMPWGPIDPRDAAEKPGSPLAPPFPDICLATGRRAVPYLRALKSLSPTTFCVLFKDPRIRRHKADLLIVQQHDAPRGENVLVVTTAPNRMSPARLETARRTMSDRLGSLPQPRVAVLIGGDSRHHQFSKDDVRRLVGGLEAKLDAGNALMITASRRTPAPLAMALADLSKRPNVLFWDGTGDNPLLAYLAWADEIVVTADSTNMVGEAAALGVPVQIFHPSGGHAKIDRFVAALSQEAAIGRFPETPATGRRAPVNSTPGLARDILARWQVFRARPVRPS
ncbi:mitochondrial fission ELM1 family protein [Shinella kummerowiae]|uniref:mitochondrial fission ELM1 family protein n=1 Tax=Shinella kummerowiae TaxID=417745 RepID=UPI0021B5B0C0|nr:mitochondrial fission ELM1 family protein [Shinella kummerowiae]MCT7663479.1 mitochondrial fission ELM1 family protein [Shinella kummerowiae]